jgi:serine/threonine-protein kinase
MTARKDPPASGGKTGRSRAKGGAAKGQKHVEPGDVLNHMFEVRRSIGRGGMGEVFEGINVSTEEPVAIKVILPHLAADPQVLAMFRREAVTLTRLSHPALVQYRTQALDPQLGAYYIVTEFIRGDNLSEILAELDAPPGDLAALMRRLAEGLAAAHRLGAIHRDLTPDNVMLAGGRLDEARIIDFGIAKDLDAGSATIVGDGFAGKLNYVAPEQLGEYGREVGPWTDVYSLALTILAVARRKDVDLGGTLVDAVDKRRKGVDVSAAPAALQPVLSKMLRHDPAERFRSMEEVIGALDDLGSGWADEPPRGAAESLPQHRAGEDPLSDPAAQGGAEEGAFSSAWADLPSEDVQAESPPADAGMAPGSTDEGWTVFLPGSKPPSPSAPARDGGARAGTIFGLGPAIAGAAFAGVLAIFVGLLWFAMGGKHGGDVADTRAASVALAPQAQVEKARGLLARLLPAQQCTSLELDGIDYEGGIAVAVRGIAGTAEHGAAAQEQIDRALRAEGLAPKSLDFSAVNIVDVGDCQPIDVFKRFARSDGPRLSAPKTQWEVMRQSGDPKVEGQVVALVQVKANLTGVTDPAYIIMMGQGELALDSTPVRKMHQDGPDTFVVEPTAGPADLGWYAAVLITGKEPFDPALVNGKLADMPGWAERFSTAATAQGWTTEMLWFKVVDEIPD